MNILLVVFGVAIVGILEGTSTPDSHWDDFKVNSANCLLHIYYLTFFANFVWWNCRAVLEKCTAIKTKKLLITSNGKSTDESFRSITWTLQLGSTLIH